MGKLLVLSYSGHSIAGGAMSESEKNASFHQKQQGSSNPLLTPEQLQRVELLKLQKELQRREREREAWREASTPRNVFTDDLHKTQRESKDETMRDGRGESPFFTKLRLGKFLE